MSMIWHWILTMKPIEIAFTLLTLSVTGIGLAGVAAANAVYRPILRNLDEIRLEGHGRASHWLIKTAIMEYERSLSRRGIPPAPHAIVEPLQYRLRHWDRPVVSWVRVSRTAITICVSLGLVGTFTGLVIALVGVSGALQEAARQSGGSQDITALLSQLKGLIGGMSTAFQASLFGVSGSVLLTVLTAYFGTFTLGDQMAADLERYLGVEHQPEDQPLDRQREMVERLDHLSNTLESALGAGISDASRAFAGAASSISNLLPQIEPVISSLGSSGSSLQVLSESMDRLTVDLRHVLGQLQAGQQVLPVQIADLKRVEASLQSALQGWVEQNSRLLKGLDLFQQSASGMHTWMQEWPAMMEGFVEKTAAAADGRAADVHSALQHLNSLITEGQREAITKMQELVTAHLAVVAAGAERKLGAHG